jgi:hypothetical protein
MYFCNSTPVRGAAPPWSHRGASLRGRGSALLLRLVAFQVLDVALLLLLLYPGLELFVALGGGELVPDLRLDLLE